MKHVTEAYLAAWSRRVESSNGTTDGWVKFYLPDDDLLNLLAVYGDDAARGTKKAGGKLFKITIEEVEEPEAVVLKRPIRTSQLAAIICNDPMFYEFLKIYHAPLIDLMASTGIKFDKEISERCAQVLRFGCSVDSRSDLDNGTISAKAFNDAFYQPFKKYKEAKV